MKPTATTHVILGALQWRPRSGYDIKQLVDRSTRFFWAASYGQIYPELGRLEREGLIEGVDHPTGRRRRRLWQLTPAGREELVSWLARDEEPLYETRDEGLLKFFFANALPADEQVALARRIGDHHARIVARLERIEADVYGDPAAERGFPYESLQHRLELHRWMARWYDEAAQRLAAGLGA